MNAVGAPRGEEERTNLKLNGQSLILLTLNRSLKLLSFTLIDPSQAGGRD